jgi:hypothetical protein
MELGDQHRYICLHDSLWSFFDNSLFKFGHLSGYCIKQILTAHMKIKKLQDYLF